MARVEFPEPGYTEFRQYFYKLRLVCGIYADFESVLVPIEENAGQNTKVINSLFHPVLEFMLSVFAIM